MDPEHAARIDIYGYDKGCPNISFRLSSSGYKGSVAISPRVSQIPIPAGQRIVLRGGWLVRGVVKVSCASVLSFRPDRGGTYLYEFDEPTPDTCTSNAARVDLQEDAKSKPTLSRIDSLVRVQTKMGFWDYTADALCDLKR